jgi:hypothetical protein
VTREEKKTVRTKSMYVEACKGNVCDVVWSREKLRMAKRHKVIV